MLDGISDTDSVGTQHSVGAWVPHLLRLDRAHVHLRVHHESAARRVGAAGADVRVHEHHVHLELRHGEEVRVRLAEQGDDADVDGHWRELGARSRSGDWARVHGACHGCSSHLRSLLHQPPGVA